MPDDKRLHERACEVLKNSPLFGAVSEETRWNFVEECKEVFWKRTDAIDPEIGMKSLYIIISGRLKVTQVDPESGRSLALFLLKEGDIFDVFSLLDGKEHIVFPIAMDNMELLSVPLQRAREWIEEHPEFNKAFLPYLGDQMRELEAFSESLVFHDTTTRLANLILKHTETCEDDMNQEHYPVKLINNLSHESLAELIGSVRSVVSTQMQKLKDEKVIISKRGHLAVKNLETLLQKCDLFHTP
jgi:CRP/FNR family transcriptional regulator